VTLAEFTYAPDRRTIERCPAGHAPVAHKESLSDDTTIAHFDGAVCAACPLADRGLGRLRVRGQPAVTLVATFKVLAENCHRAIRHVLETAKEALQTAHGAGPAAGPAIA
jgi:hypothetical protein